MSALSKISFYLRPFIFSTYYFFLGQCAEAIFVEKLVVLLTRPSSPSLANPLHPICSALLAKFCAHYTVSNLYFSLAKFCTHYIRKFKLHRKQSLPLPSDVKDHRLFELGILESIFAIKLCYSLVSHFQIIDINDLSQSILRELSIPHQEWNLTILGHEFVNNQLPIGIDTTKTFKHYEKNQPFFQHRPCQILTFPLQSSPCLLFFSPSWILSSIYLYRWLQYVPCPYLEIIKREDK